MQMLNEQRGNTLSYPHRSKSFDCSQQSQTLSKKGEEDFCCSEINILNIGKFAPQSVSIVNQVKLLGCSNANP